MNQPLLLLFLNSLFSLSLQSQLFREFAATTNQNLQAEASQWTLTDPSDNPHPISISECLGDKIVYKPDSLPPGTTLTKTFDGLETHNLLRFYVQMYYMGDYSSQTVDIKFDDITLETSQVITPTHLSSFDTCSDPLVFTTQILYYGAVVHNASSVTVKFTSNLHGTDTEVTWGLRSFSLVTDTSDTITDTGISALTFYQDPTIPRSPCYFFGAYLDDQGYCQSCNLPCKECYGPGSDQCFIYSPDSLENRLCPEGQTFLTLGCTNCVLENCTFCDLDVNQCDTCLTTCAQCDNSATPPQCQLCTVESNLVLYQGSCIESCPQGTYPDSDRICQLCQPGCLDCTGIGECSQCDTSKTTNVNGYCICPQPGMYFERDSGGCSGTCLLGCEQCINGQQCQLCETGMTVQPNGDCRCDINGFYYQNDTGSCTGQCYEHCDYCHDATSCLSCSGNRVPQGDMCKCASPRVLIGDSCECSSFMMENLNSNCDGGSLIDVVYQSTPSALFDAIFQVRMNPVTKWTSPPSVFWLINSCPFQNSDTQNQFVNYIFPQNTDILLIPSVFLEFNLQCSFTVIVNAGDNSFFVPVSFKTLSPAYPQINIRGGPLQMVSHAERNVISAQVQSSIGKAIAPSNLKITWSQTSGDPLDVSSFLNPSAPLQLAIPKCTLEKGKVYKFKLDVELLVNPGSEASQEVTVGVYAPKFQAQIVGLNDVNYHLSSEPLTLQSQLSFLQVEDECPQTTSVSDFLDLSTAMYTWECFYLDLQLSSARLLNDDESELITSDPDVHPHPDPDNLFYKSTSSPSLTVPEYYFTDYPGYQFMFYFTVTVQSQDQTPSLESFTVLKPTLEVLKAKAHLAIVSEGPFTTVSFTCMSDNDCQAYSEVFPTKFVGSSYNYQYSYKWLLNTLQSIQYTTFIRVFDYNPIEDWMVVPRILYTVSDGTNTASAFFTLPLNLPPQSGFINVYPLEGETYKTKFFVSTYGWKDTDLPVTYQFYSTYNAYDFEPAKNKMISTLDPYDYTPIVPWPYNTWSFLGVIVQDHLKSTAESSTAMIFLTNTPQSFCDFITQSSQALTASKRSDNLLQRFRLISVILEILPIWEQVFDPACTDGEYDLKFQAVTQARNIVQALDSKHEFIVQLFTDIIWSFNPEYNQDQNWQLYTDIVDSDILPGNPILPQDVYQLLLAFTDRQIYYMKKPNSTTIEDPAKIFSYINILLKSTLYNALPVEEGVSYQGVFYTYWTYKTTYCKVLQEYPYIYYGFYGLKANVTLRAGQEIPPEKCNNLIDMVFLAFRSNYTVEDADPDDYFQKLIYFDLRDSITGESLLDLFTFTLMSPISVCPIGASCNPNGEGGTQIYGIFDLRNQINKIFAKSNIAQIQNIAVLVNFKFWKSVAFWTVMAFSTGFLLSFYWLFVKHPTYCALTAHQAITAAPLFKKINLFFWVIHPLVGIYIYNDVKTPKSVKLAIYYQRLVIVMVFSTIFSSLSQGEGWVFKGYILLFNTVTVTPVNAILGRIFEWAFKTNSNKKIVSKISLFIGVFCYLALVVACFLVIFIIEAQQDASQNKSWAENFIIAFVQDLSLSPALTAVNKVLLIKLSETDRFGKTLSKSPIILGLLLPETFKSIYQRIFVPVTIKPNAKENAKGAGLSPRTTTMSPLSSNRKFLKFTTADLQPQSTTQRSSHRYELRTRIASENEIGSVDLAPMETLISNRFQTLSPEARAETIRPTSPTKQNFEKMQATNIYSKSSLTNFPTFATTLKGSILKQSNAKPFQTIEFNVKEPVEMTLDDIFQFAEQPDEGEEIPRASQLKLFKNINTMDSPIREKKKHTPMSSYLPSVELSLEQRLSEKNIAGVKKKGILKQTETKPFQMIDLSSSNQIKNQVGFPPEELSSFDGNIEETQGSQLKLSKNNKKTKESQIREKKRNTLAPSYLPSVELSLEQRISEKNSATLKKRDIFKQSESKPFQLMDLSSMNQFKEPSAIHPDELSSFDGNPEETFASQFKLLKNNSKATESPACEKRKDLTKSAPKITIGDFSSGDLPSVPKKTVQQFKYSEKTPNKPAPSMEVSSMLEFKEPPRFQPDEFSSFDENTEEAVVSLPKFKTVESVMNKKVENSK